ncbi:MAG: apolipoprotein N-acyltransferase [Akkermansiaceae bacterium]
MTILVRVGLVLLSSVLGVLVFPPFGLWWLAVVAWVPLLFAIRGVSARPAFYLGLGQGFLLYGVTLSWLWGLFGVSAVVLWIVVAAFVGGACALISYHRLCGYVGAVLAAAIWVGCEFFRAEVYALHFPWITPGTGVPPHWLSPLIGVYGVSFLVILGAVLLRDRGKSRVLGVSFLVMLLVSGFLSPTREGADVKVLAVQNEEGSFEDKFEQTVNAFDGHAAIVWPELSLGRDLDEVGRLKERLYEFGRENDVVMVVGGAVDSGEEMAFNAAITLDAGIEVGSHFKNKPVPLFNDGKKGTEAKSIRTSMGVIGTPICFDCDHESVIRRMVADGAEVILAPSLDAKPWSARQHDQHAELFRHRAAENGRWVVVAASSGRSQVIDDLGNQVATIPLMEPGVLEGMVKLETGRTIYNRFGWMTGWLCLAVAGMSLLFAFYRNVRAMKKK